MSVITADEDDLEYVTSVEANMAILRAMEQIRFREKLRTVMPGIAKALVSAGVDFSKVDYSKLNEVTDAEIDAIYEDLT